MLENMVIIRPPSEADSFLLPVTLGCSNNECTFCGAYLGIKFRIRPPEDIKRDNRSADLANASSALMCCGGCGPAAFIPNEQKRQEKNLNKCPKCNSSAVVKEEVVHEI